MASEETPPTGMRVLGDPARRLTLAIGVIYILVGITGFGMTQANGIGFIDPEGTLLLGFEVNPLHNVVHLVIGVAGLFCAGTRFGARLYGWLLVAVYGPAFVYGLFVAGSETSANFLALNIADNVLHAVTVLAGLTLALWLARPARPGPSEGPSTTHGQPSEGRVG